MFCKILVVCICIVMVNSWDKSFAIKECAMFVPQNPHPSLWGGIEYRALKIQFNNSDIESKIYHVVPVKKLDDFFTYTSRNNNYRLEFIQFLVELYNFTYTRYQENTPVELVNRMNNLTEVSVLANQNWMTLPANTKAKILDAFNTRLVRAMFTMMPFNLIIGPKKRCDKPGGNIDNELKYMIEYYDQLQILSQKMRGESSDFNEALKLLSELLKRNNHIQAKPYAYTESKWIYNEKKKCYKTNPINDQMKEFVNGNSIMETKDPMCLISIENLFTDMVGEMGEITDHDQWLTVAFPFTIDGRTFLYGHSPETHYWHIQELLPKGKMGQITSNGFYRVPFEVNCAFTINARTFYFAQSNETKYWFIKELTSDGTIIGQTSAGYMEYFYDAVFIISIENKTFLWGQSEESGHRFIQELLPGGQMGEITLSSHVDPLGYSFSYSVGGNTFVYTQMKTNPKWRTTEIQPDGTIGLSENGEWGTIYDVNFPLYFGNRTFLYNHDFDSNYWFISELLPNGLIGPLVSNGVWRMSFNVSFPFVVDGRTYFYGINAYEKEWIIREFL